MKNILLLFCFAIWSGHCAFSQLPVANFTTNNNHLCPGTCTDFINLSSNALSYQWIFQGAVPSASSAENPSTICYSNQGNYSVTLIASNSFGTDTLTIPYYIVVYPNTIPVGITQSNDTLFSIQGFTNYQWYLNGVAIAGGSNYFYVTTLFPGDVYCVAATDANGCQVESCYLVTIGNSESETGKQLTIYPNPVNSTIFISTASLTSTSSINIFDLFGQAIFSSQLDNKNPGSEISVDVQGLMKGMYLLEISDCNRTLRSKFIKQ